MTRAGICSDFDGAEVTLPNGLKNVSGYPNLIEESRRRGYRESDLEYRLGGNLLRVRGEVDAAVSR